MIEIIKQVLLYERVQEEYDLMIGSLVGLSDEAIADRIHEVMLETLILELVVEECYTEEELEYLLKQNRPLTILYNVLNNI